MQESTKYLLKEGRFKECHDPTLCECILNHSWEKLVYERLSGEQYQMYLYCCRNCGQYWFGYFEQYAEARSADDCSLWFIQASINEAEDILNRKALGDPMAFHQYLSEFEPASKIKLVRDEIVCIAPESYPWGWP